MSRTDNNLTMYQKVLNNLKWCDPINHSQKIKLLFVQSIKLVNDKNVNVEQSDYTLIELAAFFGNAETIKYLLKHHSKKLKNNSAQLGEAIKNTAQYGHDKSLELLISDKVVLNKVTTSCVDDLGEATKNAVRNGHDKSFELLISNKIILNKVIKHCIDDLGESIEWAVKNGNDKSLELLISNKVVLNKVIKHCHNKLVGAIKVAAKNNNYKSLELLVQLPEILNVIINKYPKQVNPTILWTIHSKSIEKLKLLLITGAREKKVLQSSEVNWQKLLNYLSNNNSNSDAYKIIKLYINTISKDVIEPDELKEMIKLAYERDLYTMLSVIKNECNPSTQLTNGATAEVIEKDTKATQNLESIKIICKNILLDNKYQYNDDNRMIYGNLIKLITAQNFKADDPITKQQIEQITKAIKHGAPVNRFLTKISSELKNKKLMSHSLLTRQGNCMK